ncbi:MAG: hypothetical protein AB7V16_13585 [Vulcanibacillus sp.]
MNTKKEVLKIIENLPDSVTIEDIMSELYVRAKIEVGVKELDSGKTINHENVKEHIDKWLT